MLVWFGGKFENVEIGQKVLVARYGSGKSYFGEFGTLTKATKMHLVFTTDSGAIVKTKIDNIYCVVGKAAKERYFVSLNVEGREDMIHEDVAYWNSNKCCFEKK